MLNPKVHFRFFDKTFSESTGVYGLHRFPTEDQANRDQVQRNYHAIKQALGVNHLLILKQVHGNTVIDADTLADFSFEPAVDGAVISQPGIALSVQSSDCVPLLFASDDGKILGAAHCGWKGAKANILANVISLMRLKGAKGIVAIVGPAIHQESYEVDLPFYKPFIEAQPLSSSFFKQHPQKSDKLLFDLPGVVMMQLKQLGIETIIDHCENTYTHPEKYYSYRRDMHTQYKAMGTNILSTILVI